MKNSIQMNNTSEMKRFVSRHATTSSGAEGQLSTLRLLSLSKHNSQLSTPSYAGGGYNLILVQLVENNKFPKAIVPILLLAKNYQLSIVHYPLSIIHYPL